MKKIFFIIIFVLSLVSFAFAQKSPIKWGKVSDEEMNMEYYSKDSSACAVILCDYGVSLESGFTRHVRIKILKEEGLEYANVKIPYLSFYSFYIPIKIKAQSYTKNDNQEIEITKLEKKEVYDEKIYNYQRIKSFSIPNVKIGSIIEYSYYVRAGYIQEWQFQREIPIIISDYSVSFHSYYNFLTDLQGITIFDEYENKEIGNLTTVHYIKKNIPALIETDYINDINNYYSKVKFYFENPYEKTTWKDINMTLLHRENLGQQLNNYYFIKLITKDMQLSDTTDNLYKMKIIYNYVKDNIRWNEIYDYSKSYEYSLVEINNLKTGSSSDINLLLADLLFNNDIKVNLVVLSTVNNGKINHSISNESQFNHLICLVTIGNDKYLLDATDPYRPYTLLDEQDLNGKGLILKEEWYDLESVDWIEIENIEKTKKSSMANLTLSDDGTLTGKMVYQLTGYYARDFRKEINLTGESDFSKQYLQKNIPNIFMESYKFENIENLDKPVSAEFSFSTSDFSQITDSLIYITTGIGNVIMENPFKNNNRLMDVTFPYTFEEKFVVNLTIPDNYEIIEMPKSETFKISEDKTIFKYLISQNENTIQILYHFTLGDSQYTKGTEYSTLQNFYSSIVSKNSEQIVLKKK